MARTSFSLPFNGSLKPLVEGLTHALADTQHTTTSGLADLLDKPADI